MNEICDKAADWIIFKVGKLVPYCACNEHFHEMVGDPSMVSGFIRATHDFECDYIAPEQDPAVQRRLQEIVTAGTL